MNNREWIAQLSTLIGVPYYPEHQVFGDKNGALLGVQEGYIVGVGIGKDKRGHAGIKILLRHGKGSDPQQVKQALNPAKGKFKTITADETSALMVRTYSFGKPDTAAIAEEYRNIFAALKSCAQPIKGSCEECGRTEPQIVLLNNIPMHYCANCRQQLSQKLDAAAVEYEKLDTNLMLGLLYGLGAAFLGSIAWGGVAYLIHRIFLWGAIVIGVFVGKGVVLGIGKVNWPGRVLMGILTAGSVAFGDAIFYALTVMSQEQVAFTTALKAVLANFWKIEASARSGWISIVFALIGAVFVIHNTRAPAFKARFVVLGTPATTLSSAAAK